MIRRLCCLAALVLVTIGLVLTSASRPVMAQRESVAPFLSAPFPFGLVAARKSERLAWLAYEEGKRNVYTAALPEYAPLRVTSFVNDDGTDISDLRISDNGSTIVFVRGTAPNRDGWAADPTSHPDGAERAIWAARLATAAAPTSAPAPLAPLALMAPPAPRTPTVWRVAEGSAPELAPDGSAVLFVKNGEIYRAKLTPTKPALAIDRGDVPFIRARGTSSMPRWSPDGSKIAFVSSRVDHSFIGVYDVATRKVAFMAPSVDRDTAPAWAPEGKRLAFVRRPGLPFGQQAQQGGNGIGLPNGPAYAPNGPPGPVGRGAPPPTTSAPAPSQPTAPTTGDTATPPARGSSSPQPGRGAQTTPGTGASPATGAVAQATPTSLVPAPAVPAPPPPPPAEIPGLMRATFRGGYTLALMVADVATGEARECWHNAPNDRVFTNIPTVQWAGTRLVFPATVPDDEWDRYFSVAVDGSTPAPVLLTTTDGLIEDATSVAFSPDGSTLYYSTNAKDIDRRHIWSVPTAGGTPKQVTTGEGIETSPVVMSLGTRLAALTADAQRPQTVGVFPAGGGRQELVFPTLARTFPLAQHVVPESVIVKAPDGLDVHTQLFLPRNLAAGERKPALIFVHGGPVRQMLLGYHYMHFYHIAYGINEWLASQGYVVLSVNYRSGIGYGRSFRNAPNTGGRGNAEYQDVLAAAKYLQTRSDVDPARIGIWGLSYGGVLTAQALARNSDIFKAGVDLAGVHLWGSSLDRNDVSYQASVISAIDGWKSPVLLVHGDDDRNVAFQQTTGLVQLLRARNVDFELIVFPDDTHETLLHSRWLYVFGRMETFFNKHLRAQK